MVIKFGGLAPTSHLEYWLNLNLAVHNGIAIICIYASKNFGGF